MEDGAFPQDNVLGNLSNTSMEYDLMDELLSDGCWLEAAAGSDFLQQDSSTSNALFNPSSYFWPISDSNHYFSTPEQPENNVLEEKERLIFPDNMSSIELETENSLELQANVSRTTEVAESSGRPDCYQAEGVSELSRSWWIGPRANPGPFASVRDRLFQALGYIKDSIGSEDVLIQIWVPINKGNKRVLTTNDQPYALDPNCQKLAKYRSVSLNYQFPAEENSNESVGLPGRVFLEKVPEWTPDVRFFSSEEYPRIKHAQQYDVRGTIALPVFERGNRSCLGVLEVVTTTQKINYHSELENVCQALEAVDLKSSEDSVRPFVKACSESYQAALPEILEVLRAVCEAHRLPLAQTWVPCIQQGKGGCRHSDENYTRCISTIDSACWATDSLREFHEACSEHHLFIGQGVVGRAFMTNQPCFESNIAALEKKEYPLKHYARMFGLRAAVAIRLRSIFAGTNDYVLEFFLPVDCQDIDEQRVMLDSLSVIIQQICRNLRVITDKELQEESNSSGLPTIEEIPKLGPVLSKESSQASWITSMEAQQKGKLIQKEGSPEGFKAINQWIKPEEVLTHVQTISKFHQVDKGKIKGDVDSSFGEGSFSGVAKTVEKRKTKVEKTISLQVLRQYFAGSLKDAAKNIGVCPTTLKRICRQHGIKRWPSRKIKKVGHSLRKLQVVMDSVHGAEGAFKIGSLYANFSELTSPNQSGSNLFSTSKETDQLKPLKAPSGGLINQAVDGVFSPPAAASKSPTSSCSQSSNSSLCCSSAKQKHPHIAQYQCSEDALTVENLGGVLKRARSEAELHVSIQEEPTLLERSHSHKSFSEDHGQVSRDKYAFRVKVTYGEEKVRFSMPTNWGYKDLQQEVSKRFHIEYMNRVDLKYLDDDSEWILLTCDADVEECIDVYKSSRTNTIKLSVHQASQPNLGSSFGSI
ncbi:hypothetical protein IFM89_011554 [Coptis chinensis]|uniref:Uncharacterized protein n=1 Tax=Coptis chinensis TaxID=261450 RepID=A0A835LV94_9MAGN|nr:hypothetical protein IFM89_011554 [Coptis chinensis]